MRAEYWGLISYKTAWQKQENLFNELIEAKKRGTAYENRIVFCEHPHVFTLGKHGKEKNILLDERLLRSMNVEYFHIDRGGDVTYHGPGQLVCYPILNLEDFHIGVKQYVYLLEESVIQICAHYGVSAGRVEGATGVWLSPGTPYERKICAIGIRCSHYVTMHGLALNVTTDLRYFNYIHPCGFTDKGVTSLQKETGVSLSIEEVCACLLKELSTRFVKRDADK